MSDDNYRLCVVRRAPLATPADLEATLDWLVHALVREDPLLFMLSGLSPSEKATLVLDGQGSMIPAFLSTSAIEWNFGREAVQPTHEIVFFNPEEGARVVVLRLSFVAGGAASTGPGLVAELVLGPDAAGPTDAKRGAHLDKLFSMLLAALLPDYGHVELPGYPDSRERPAVYDVGWITYFSRAERPLPPALDPPAVMVPTDAGTKIFATPTLALERHAALAPAIDRVREQLAPHLDEEAPEPEPQAVPPGHVQKPTFLSGPGGQPPPTAGPTFLAGPAPIAPPPHPIDDEATVVGEPPRRKPALTMPFSLTPPAPGTRVDPLPFGQRLGPPSTPRVDATPFRRPPGAGGAPQPPAPVPPTPQVPTPPAEDPDPNRRKPR